MRAALKALVSIGSRRGGRTIAVLGPMRELGTASASAHAEVGTFARAHGVDIVLSVGPAARPLGRIGVSDIPSALTWLDDHLGSDDTVLVKASRAAELDIIAHAITRVRRRIREQTEVPPSP